MESLNIVLIFMFVLVRVCTQHAQQDLRYEENIDAFSMNNNQGRISPTLRMDSKDEGN